MLAIKKLFSNPKKAAVTLVCAGVMLVALGVCIVVYAAGGPNAASPSGDVTLEEARAIALADAGVAASAARFTKAELDYEDGVAVYELEFYTSAYEYEYEIDAATGAVLEYEWERR